MRTREQVFSQIQKAADALRAGTAMTSAEAICKAVEVNPALYVEYSQAPSGPVAPEPVQKRETVQEFLAALLEKKAEQIQKARKLSGYDAYVTALQENPKIADALRDHKFAKQTVNDFMAESQKTPVQKVVRA